MNQQFLNDVLVGLKSNPKKLSSKYFYDEVGSKIFQEIMQMPEYYLTRSELEILQMQSEKIWKQIESLRGKREVSVLELGAGDGSKTKWFLEAGEALGWKITYRPIDISVSIFEETKKNVPKTVEYKPIVGDFLECLAEVKSEDHFEVVLFLGSNIGNYNGEKAVEFLHQIQQNIHKDDLFILGVDLRKSPSTILPAYNDANKITARFNLNLLNRINKELSADFQLDKFEHYATYDIVTGEAKSYLVSLKEQVVTIGSEKIHFPQWDFIHTEISKKYGKDELNETLNAAGFTPNEFYFDCKHYFANVLCTA